MPKRQREIELSFEKILSLPNDMAIVKIKDSHRSYIWQTNDIMLELANDTSGYIDAKVFSNGIVWMINLFDNRENVNLLRQEITISK